MPSASCFDTWFTDRSGSANLRIPSVTMRSSSPSWYASMVTCCGTRGVSPAQSSRRAVQAASEMAWRVSSSKRIPGAAAWSARPARSATRYDAAASTAGPETFTTVTPVTVWSAVFSRSDSVLPRKRSVSSVGGAKSFSGGVRISAVGTFGGASSAVVVTAMLAAAKTLRSSASPAGGAAAEW